MLYKRPNFKMGGSPTGIETLEPRVMLKLVSLVNFLIQVNLLYLMLQVTDFLDLLQEVDLILVEQVLLARVWLVN